MLFYPFLDKSWHYPAIKSDRRNISVWFLLVMGLTLLLLSDAISIKIVLFNLFLVAIPEEWFFRAYFQTRLQAYLKNNREFFRHHRIVIGIIVTSVLFASTHAIMQNNLLLLPLIFIPSVLFGYLYYLSRDFVLVTLVHLISNMILLRLMDSGLFFSHALKSLFSVST